MRRGTLSEEPFSLLFQAKHCTDEPLKCGEPKVSNVLSVERAEFESGSARLSMNVSDGQCQVWFAGKGDDWRLVDHECNGD